jgi:hypothetical protein
MGQKKLKLILINELKIIYYIEMTDITLYLIRQNPYNLKSQDFYSLIEEQSIITCPYGHNKDLSKKISDNTYNFDVSSRQDKRFIEDIKINDYIIVPVEKTKKCIIKKIISDPRVKTFEYIFDIKNKNKVINIKNISNICDEEKKDINLEFEPKKMYYRDCINIGVFEYDLNHKIPINSLCEIKNESIKNFVITNIPLTT